MKKIPFYKKNDETKTPIEVSEKNFEKVLEKHNACGKDFSEALVNSLLREAGVDDSSVFDKTIAWR